MPGARDRITKNFGENLATKFGDFRIKLTTSRSKTLQRELEAKIPVSKNQQFVRL